MRSAALGRGRAATLVGTVLADGLWWGGEDRSCRRHGCEHRRGGHWGNGVKGGAANESVAAAVWELWPHRAARTVAGDAATGTTAPGWCVGKQVPPSEGLFGNHYTTW
eukprot:TRINITY_DN5580_c0_g1_i1.p3 TRINITY_DN5580_c0_g1~~TRINITY_DN5580_c0_g1_i1.p3  ORF type:complete len:108 (+),score=5.76 TRINITY_DN5580_c0_g1_i1:386-709(+)